MSQELDSKKIDLLLYMDGIAILLIVLFHECSYCTVKLDNTMNIIYNISATIGLALFTFSAGYKLSHNHFDHFGKNGFLRPYIAKRFIRLIKPYFGYTLIALVSLILVNIYVFNRTDNSYLFTFQNFSDLIFGYNPVALQLWYLYFLAAITLFILSIILIYNYVNERYFSFPEEKSKKYMFVILTIILALSLIFYFQFMADQHLYIMLVKFFKYSPVFVYAMVFAIGTNSKRFGKYFRLLSIILAIAFILILYTYVSSWPIISWYFNYCYILFGFTAPCFVLECLRLIPKILSRALFQKLGEYSFPIYLFHLPVILVILDWYLFTKNHSLNPIWLALIMVAITLIASVASYKLIRLVKLNFLIE